MWETAHQAVGCQAGVAGRPTHYGNQRSIARQRASFSSSGRVYAGLVDGMRKRCVARVAPRRRGARRGAAVEATARRARATRRTRAISPRSALRIAASRLPVRSQATIVSQIATPLRAHARRAASRKAGRPAARRAPRRGSARSGCADARSTGARRATPRSGSCRGSARARRARGPAAGRAGVPPRCARRRYQSLRPRADRNAISSAMPANTASPSQWLPRNARKHASRSRPRISHR